MCEKFSILLSCMYEKNTDIITNSNIKADCVIINQCDENYQQEFYISDKKKCLWINSVERGLSKSRNMAIHYSNADICLIADNDEFFDNDIESKILKTYKELPEADIIIFDLDNRPTK